LLLSGQEGEISLEFHVKINSLVFCQLITVCFNFLLSNFAYITSWHQNPPWIPSGWSTNEKEANSTKIKILTIFTSQYTVKRKCNLVDMINAKFENRNLNEMKLDDNYNYFNEDYISNQAKIHKLIIYITLLF
jgi:hypothetical protein